MKFKVDWETDGEEVRLPSVVEVPDDISLDDVADWLSDEYGWLVKDATEVLVRR